MHGAACQAGCRVFWCSPWRCGFFPCPSAAAVIVQHSSFEGKTQVNVSTYPSSVAVQEIHAHPLLQSASCIQNIISTTDTRLHLNKAEVCGVAGVLAYALSRCLLQAWWARSASPPPHSLSSQLGYHNITQSGGIVNASSQGGSHHSGRARAATMFSLLTGQAQTAHWQYERATGDHSHPGRARAATMFSLLTGQAQAAHRQHERVSGDHSLSQSESGSEGSSSRSASRSGSESNGSAAHRSMGSAERPARRGRQHVSSRPGGASSQGKHARKQNVLRAVRSKSGAKSWFQGKRAEGVAEGLWRGPRPRKARHYGKIDCGQKFCDVSETIEQSLGSKQNVSREQSFAGNNLGQARSAAGLRRRTGTGDDAAGALNVVVIDRSKQVSTAGMKM